MAAADVAAVSGLLVRAWRWAYADIVPEEAMPTIESRELMWQARGTGCAWVAEVAGRVAGVVAIDLHEPELALLYVDPAAQGAGLGAALHDHALTELRTRGHRHAHLWVLRDSGQGRDFYAHRGWRPDGDGTTGERAGVAAIRLVREL